MDGTINSQLVDKCFKFPLLIFIILSLGAIVFSKPLSEAYELSLARTMTTAVVLGLIFLIWALVWRQRLLKAGITELDDPHPILTVAAVCVIILCTVSIMHFKTVKAQSNPATRQSSGQPENATAADNTLVSEDNATAQPPDSPSPATISERVVQTVKVAAEGPRNILIEVGILRPPVPTSTPPPLAAPGKTLWVRVGRQMTNSPFDDFNRAAESAATARFLKMADVQKAVQKREKLDVTKLMVRSCEAGVTAIDDCGFADELSGERTMTELDTGSNDDVWVKLSK